MKHIASFSTGLPSAFVVERLRQRYGDDNVIVVFMDVLNEDDDNYRFKRELAEKRWQGLELIDLCEGRNPWQVAEDENMIFNQRRHPCTRILKIEPFMDWLKTLPEKPTIHIGIDFTETHRCSAIERNYTANGYDVDFPLLWRPIEVRPYSDVARMDWEIEQPRMYKRGFSHANCGKLGCFAWGIGDWVRFYVYEPESFLVAEDWERRMRLRPGREKYAICRDQSNGEVRPRTLAQIRTQYESTPQLSLFGERSGCVSCGVGSFVEAVIP